MIQIDMQMPKNCLDCPACNEYLMCAIPVNGRKWGENDVREFGKGRPEWCLMKEQELVRCKDCKWGECSKNMKGEDMVFCYNGDTGIEDGFLHDPDWFCADGVKRE